MFLGTSKAPHVVNKKHQNLGGFLPSHLLSIQAPQRTTLHDFVSMFTMHRSYVILLLADSIEIWFTSG